MARAQDRQGILRLRHDAAQATLEGLLTRVADAERQVASLRELAAGRDAATWADELAVLDEGLAGATAAAALVADHNGQVPPRLDDLVKLPGVGRKTANVVLGNAFGIPGITVDTHFGRLARRFGWTEETDPVKVEHAVGELFPKKDWTMLSHHLIWHGRRVCHSQKPACGACPVAKWCPSYGAGPTDPVAAAKLVKTEGRA